MNQIPPIIALLIIVNIVTPLVFGVDKLKSMSGSWRIPENSLLLIALFGPFGAYASMILFRHKTRKTKFLLVPLFMFIQIGAIIYLRPI